jgi:ABC-type polysaccharide transport system permease subunit
MFETLMNMCGPALIYMVFALIQIIADVYRGHGSGILLSVIIWIMVTYLLNSLCERDLTPVAWMIVLIPYLFMVVVIGSLLFIFTVEQEKGGSVKTTTNGNGTTTVLTTGQST